MLSQLRLENLGVVEDADIEFGPGLTALTGETGAGKTMVVAGLGLLLGGRGDAGVVRRGAVRARVTGSWEGDEALGSLVSELGGDIDGELVTQRQITAQGRSRAVVGGCQVPVSALAKLSESLATIHGQNEQVRLVSADRQREILDAYAQPAELPRYRTNYAELKACETELDALTSAEAQRLREIDLLRFGLGEIDEIAPVPDEDHALAAEANRLADADELKLRASEIHQLLSGDETDFEIPGAVGMVGQARKVMQMLAQRDELAQPLADRLVEVDSMLSELAVDVASYSAELSIDPDRLEEVHQRRAALSQLQRKYGPELTDVLAWAVEARQKLASLDGAETRIENLRSRVRQLRDLIAQDAQTISATRAAAAKELSQAVHTELAALAMPHARVIFQLRAIPPGPYGIDKIELLLSANPGSDPVPLGKVASGGELSRVRLALEVVLATPNTHHTFVFDEVDAGVGGAVGLEIGRRLQRLATTSQVIVVTHLAQVAAFADHHFVVDKQSDGQLTTSGIREVIGDERVAELTRMMSGDASSDTGIRHAAELLQQARRQP